MPAQSRFGQWSSGPLNVSNVPPSAAGSGNYRGAEAPASSGGGSIGPNIMQDFGHAADDTSSGGVMGWGDTSASSSRKTGFGTDGSGIGLGGGYQEGGSDSGGGGFGWGDTSSDGPRESGFGRNGSGIGLEDGGEVPEVADTGTVDPMSFVKSALAAWRQKMGLPASFYSVDNEQNGSVQQQGFDDGGEVEDQGDGGVIPTGEAQSSSSSQSGPVNPKAAIAYLSGAGAVQPEVARALEARADPQGTMSPGERMLRAIQAAPSDDARFGLMQHYRSRYNAFSGGARAALDKGNLAQAAVNATQAFAHLPTGHSVQFAPARGGIAMLSKKAGAQTKSFDEGGEVEQGIMDRLPDDQDSENIEDRRNENDGVVYKDKVTQVNPKWPDMSRKEDEEGVVRKKRQSAFEDGGEVEEDDSEGVIPTEQAQEPQEAQEPVTAAVTPDEGETGQPTVLSPQQFKSMLEAGYDKPLDRGWKGFIDDIMSAAGPSSAQAADAGSASAPQAKEPGFGEGWTPVKALGSKIKSLFGGGGDDTAAAAQEGQPQSPAQPQGAPQGVRTPAGPPTALQGVKTPELPFVENQAPQAQDQAPQEQPKPKGKVTDPDDFERRVNAQANRMFPSVGQQAQRSQYIQHMLQENEKHKTALGVAGVKGDVEREKERGRDARLEKTELGRTARAINSTDSKERMAQAAQLLKGQTAQLHELMSTLRTNILQNPSLAKDPAAALRYIEPYAQRFNMHPQDLGFMVQNLPQLTQGGGGQGGQQAPAQKVGDPSASYKVGEDYPRTKNGKTEIWYFGTDGLFHKKK